MLIGGPRVDEIEVSVFGPGYGESIVIHAGLGDWVVVDSCQLPRDTTPVALQYLEAIGVNVETQLKLVVATHWHDDHIRGLAAIVERAQQARFVASMAMANSIDFLTAVSLDERRLLAQNSGVTEFAKIIRVLKARRQASATYPIEWALVDRTIWNRPGSINATAQCLSPSDADFHLLLTRFQNLMPKPGTDVTSVPDESPNLSAVVVWMCCGQQEMLLGSDLENNANPHRGWSAILANVNRPTGRASVYKVPHHGSATAHEPQVWQQLLTTNPFAAVTPFNHPPKLPQPAMIQTLRGLTANAFLTNVAGDEPTKFSDRTATKTIRDFKYSIRQPRHYGQVRFRADAMRPNSWSFELSPVAQRL